MRGSRCSDHVIAITGVVARASSARRLVCVRENRDDGVGRHATDDQLWSGRDSGHEGRQMKRKILVPLLLIGALGVLYLVMRDSVSMDSVIANEDQLRTWLETHPVRGFTLAFIIYVVISLVPGLGGKSIIVGWFFDFWKALIIVNVGLTIVALIMMMISRHVCRDFVETRLSGWMTRVNAGLARDGTTYIFSARLLHFPFSILNYVLGATRVRVRDFIWTTQIGILPGNIVFVLMGDQIPSLGQLHDLGWSAFADSGFFSSLFAVTAIPLLIHFLVRRWVRRWRGSVDVFEGQEDV